MIKKMQPVPPQDRPKVIAVSISLVVALGFLVRNLVGTTTLARSRPPAMIAAAVPDSPAGTRDAAAPAIAPNEAPVASAGPGSWGEAPLHDPFRPIAHPTQKAAPASQPKPVRPAWPAPAKTPARVPVAGGAPRPAPGVPHSALGAACRELTAARADSHRQKPPATPAARVALTGTVGSGNSAVATFRIGDETVFARPQQMVAGWRVLRIQMGQVWLSRHNVRRLVLVGKLI